MEMGFREFSVIENLVNFLKSIVSISATTKIFEEEFNPI